VIERLALDTDAAVDFIREDRPSPPPINRVEVWIAALCIQYKMPLLTNDGGFDHIDGLTVIHW